MTKLEKDGDVLMVIYAGGEVKTFYWGKAVSLSQDCAVVSFNGRVSGVRHYVYRELGADGELRRYDPLEGMAARPAAGTIKRKFFARKRPDTE